MIVLVRVDGSKTLGRIADALCINRSTARKHCRRTLEDGILDIRMRDRRPNGGRSMELTKAKA